jgi:hypothetical protein
LISGAAKLEFGSAASADVKFDTGAAGLLQLDHSIDFSGTVSGFQGADQLDLHDILLVAATSATYTENQAGDGGTLSVSDGVHTADINILGQFTQNDFDLTTDGAGGTLIKYHGSIA